MAFGSSSGSATEEGGNILAEWDSNWDFGDAFNSLLGNYGSMFELGLENMRRQQPRDAQAFDLWKQGKASALKSDDLAREMAKKAYADERAAMFARKKAEDEAKAFAQRQRTIANNPASWGPAGAYGGSSAHQSGAQLDAYGTDIGGGYTQGVANGEGRAPVTYTPPSGPTFGYGSGSGGGQTNINNVAGPTPASAFGALSARGAGLGVSNYVPFQPAWNTEFESADLTKDRRR